MKSGSTISYQLLLTRQLIASSVSHPFWFVDALVSSSKVRLASSEQQAEWNVQTVLSALINTQIYLPGQFAGRNVKTHFIRISIKIQKSKSQHLHTTISNKKELLLHARTQMRFKSIILCERKQTWNYILYNPKF